VGRVQRECKKVESNKKELPKFREIQFRVTSVGATITSFAFTNELAGNLD